MKEINITNSINNKTKSEFRNNKFCQKPNNLKFTKSPKCILIFILSVIFVYIKTFNPLLYSKKYDSFNLKQIKLDNNMGLTYLILEKYQKKKIDWPLPKEILLKPLMTEKELKAFLHFMKKENIYFEFGSGGSTNIASFYKLKVYSVESDKLWHQNLKSRNITAIYLTVDLKSKEFGYPGKDTTLKDWKKYIEAYKEEFNADIILIDGRFRIACSLNIFSKIRNDTIVLIHDYKNRKEYHIIEKFYKKIESWDTLYAFIKRSDISKIPDDIYNRYLNVQFI